MIMTIDEFKKEYKKRMNKELDIIFSRKTLFACKGKYKKVCDWWSPIPLLVWKAEQKVLKELLKM